MQVMYMYIYIYRHNPHISIIIYFLEFNIFEVFTFFSQRLSEEAFWAGSGRKIIKSNLFNVNSE